MIAYPKAFPFAEIRDIISNVKGNTVKENKAQMAKAVWTVQGYAQDRLFGEPTIGGGGSMFASAPVEIPSDEEAVAMLQSAMATAEDSEDPSEQKMTAINWKPVLGWAIKLLPLIIGL